MSTPAHPSPSHNSFRQVVGNAGVLLGGKAMNGVFNLATVAITARALGVETFGVLVLIHAYAQTIGEMVRFQAWQALLRYGTGSFTEGRFSDFHRVLRFSLRLDIAGGVAGVLIAMAGVWLIGTGLGWRAEHQQLVTAYALSIFFMASATPTGVLRLVDRFDLLALHSPVESLTKLSCVVVAWQAGAGLKVYLAIWFAAKFTAFLYLFGAAWWALRRQGALKRFRDSAGVPLVADLPGIWRFVWSTNFSSTLWLAFSQFGTLFVGALLGPAEAALYRIAKQFADAIAKPTNLVGPALYPELARLVHGNQRKAVRKLALQLALAGGGMASLVLLVVALLGGSALGFLIGPEYVAAKPVLLWLLGAAVIGVWALPLEPLLISTGHATTAFTALLCITVPYVPLLYWSIDHYGLIGAGVAAVLGMLALFVTQLCLVLWWFRKPVQPAG